MWLHEMDQATEEERDALARRILTSLYEIAAAEKGLEIVSIKIRKKNGAAPTTPETTPGKKSPSAV